MDRPRSDQIGSRQKLGRLDARTRKENRLNLIPSKTTRTLCWLASLTWLVERAPVFAQSGLAGEHVNCARKVGGRLVAATDEAGAGSEEKQAGDPTCAGAGPGRAPDQRNDPTTMFSHPESGRFWFSAQINEIFQGHASFRAKYSGLNSLRPGAERDGSSLMTFYTGIQLSKNTAFLLDVESAGGRGLSGALGIAGFTDLDVVRSPDLGWTPYVARWIFRHVIPLGGDSVENERSFLSFIPALPARRIEIMAGKFSVVDFFDLNSVGSDSHLQFLNWTVDNNGAYDYVANTRGYTDGVIVEYDDRGWAVRFGEGLMPKTANGTFLDADIARAHAENFEIEFHPSLVPRRRSALRILSYLNHANMGSYRHAIHAFEAGLEPVPDVTLHPPRTRAKYGFGLNAEQELPGGVRLFGRWGWNDGRNESFAYTEVDRTLALGGDVKGNPWKRRNDKFGVAFAVNQISGDHREYLALGGHGFILGDGALNYGLERIVESYYTAHLWRGVFASADVQHVTNPGYNRDRGPVWVPSLRLHVDF